MQVVAVDSFVDGGDSREMRYSGGSHNINIQHNRRKSSGNLQIVPSVLIYFQLLYRVGSVAST